MDSINTRGVHYQTQLQHAGKWDSIQIVPSPRSFGCKYDHWLRGDGSTSKAPLRDFLRSVHPELPQKVPKTTGHGWFRAGSNGFSGRKIRMA